MIDWLGATIRCFGVGLANQLSFMQSSEGCWRLIPLTQLPPTTALQQFDRN